MKYSEDFPWNGSCLVENQYQEDNYYFIDYKNDSNKCIIFFSGNGLYYPNVEENFTNTILQDNRYEWTNVEKSFLFRKNYKRVIFVRDIFKQWYVLGINNRINSIQKLYELLSDLCKGFEVTTVGNSAGGYIATLMGLMLQAKSVFSFSGQFVLDQSANGPIMDYYREDEKVNKFFDTRKFMNSKTQIFYFCPYYCADDYKQFSYLANCSTIYIYKFKSKEHGKTVKGIDYKLILNTDCSKLLKIYLRNEDKIIIDKQFSKEIEPPFYMEVCIIEKIIRKLYKIFKKSMFVKSINIR